MKPVEEFIYRMTFNAKTMTVDVEQVGELIRCKECKYCRDYCRIIEDVKYEHACALKEECGYPYGPFRVSEEDYCSRAERKENE